MALKKTGLLGGSFDPVHLAHIALAETARTALALDEVQLIPAADPWQRGPLAATAAHRLAMLHIATAGHAHLHVNPLEIQRGGPTYTIDTLRELPKNADYFWILGADQLENFCSWQYWQEIASLVTLAVAQRPGARLTAAQDLIEHLEKLDRHLIELPFEPTEISATLVRQRLARGESTDGLLDVAVAQYIKQNGLYQAPVA
ncbi:nicotinate (nicotinamide) nucleotide adenylyltransferase [Pollutimonas subterranea]|uniref:Probable nicotinate-nucleotide adenylyltransferase n=1 Tax=Pollutimonas subterranea TaxID=2045210 RepID=A0A2N4TZV1_9BURK|nr:nicotinate (nicotinamide) nucleotide adenylyltransferase [Pollutimonas subterranea]PLC48295.1 nicotinate (nicotinamide) nucleotide adenylyltransferase [Pollutimonas subterranea]